MEELKQCYEKLQAILKEMESKHETPVDNLMKIVEKTLWATGQTRILNNTNMF